MKYKQMTMTMDELRKVCRDWALEIAEGYRPDLIVFIAKSGFIIASEFATTLNVPMAEIMASRSGSKLRKIVAPLFKIMPMHIRNRIVSSNMMYFINEKKKERNVILTDALLKKASKGMYRRLLLIDDSIDTGWTFLTVFDSIRELFDECEIRTLALIEMSSSEERFRVDYSLFKDTLLLTPAQVDSREYDKFMKQYHEWRLRDT